MTPLKLGLNGDFDRSQELANQHKTSRQIKGEVIPHSKSIRNIRGTNKEVRGQVAFFIISLTSRSIFLFMPASSSLHFSPDVTDRAPQI